MPSYTAWILPIYFGFGSDIRTNTFVPNMQETASTCVDRVGNRKPIPILKCKSDNCWIFHERLGFMLDKMFSTQIHINLVCRSFFYPLKLVMLYWFICYSSVHTIENIKQIWIEQWFCWFCAVCTRAFPIYSNDI